MSIFGWVLHLGRCAYLDDDSVVLSVNFVMPAGEKNLSEWKLGNNPPGFPSSQWTSKDFLKEKLEKHLYPWQWEETTWKIFGLNKDGESIKDCEWEADFHSGYGDKPSLNPGIGNIYECLKTEISSNTKECESVFSADPKYAEKENKDRKSYPHIFAPLTHLPGIISNKILNLSGFLKISKDDVNNIKNVKNLEYLTAFPSYKIDKDKFGPIPATTFLILFKESNPIIKNPEESIPIAECSYSKITEGEGVKICYLQNALKITNEFWDKEKGQVSKVEISTHQKSDFVYEAELRTYLHPIQLLSEGFKKFIDENRSNPEVISNELNKVKSRIFNIFGLGWDRIKFPSSSENFKPHILDYFFLEESNFDNLLVNKDNENNNSNNDDKKWSNIKNDLANIKDIPADDIKKIVDRYTSLLKKIGLTEWGEKLKEIWESNSNQNIDRLFEAFLYLSGPNALNDEPVARAAWNLNIAGWIKNIDLEKENLFPSVEKIAHDALWKSEIAARMVRLFWEKDNSTQFSEWFRNPEKILKSPMNGESTETIADRLSNYLCNRDLDKKIIASVTSNIKEIAELLSSEEKENVQAENKDTGLTLAIKEETEEAEIRGFAIALRAGFKGTDEEMKWDDSRTKWITDTHCVVLEKASEPKWLKDSDQNLVLHETVGATLDHGNLVASFLYNGRPIASIPADKDGKAISDNIVGEDLDGTNCLDFRWFEDEQKKESQLPLLGYGLYYQAIATAIDNAGGIKATSLRSEESYTQLDNTNEIFGKSKEPERYLSHEAPKALSIQPKTTTEKSHLELALSCHEESIVNLYLKKNEEIKSEKSKSTQVYMLCPAEANNDDSHYSIEARGLKELTFEIGSPDADADFITRWMNTEIFLAEKELEQFRKEPFDKAKKEKFIAFRDLRVKERKQNKTGSDYKPYIPFHPAVTHIGMKFEYLDKGAINPIPKDSTQSIPIIKEIKFNIENKEIIKYRVELKIASVIGNTILAALKSRVDKDKGKDINIQEMTLSIPSDTQVKVSYYCLMPNWMYEDSNNSIARFSRSKQADTKTFEDYHAFFSAEQWFEVLPKDFLTEEIIKENKLIELALEDEKSDADVFVLNAMTSDDNAIKLGKWTLGGHLERHEWHWTGYAVDFPSDNGLDQWLIRHTGVESYRESIDFEFETIWSEKKEKQQILKNGPITRLTLPDSRPGRYVAYTMRPRLRYQRWLNPRNEYVKAWSDTVFACGRIIPGSTIDATKTRLPIPALKWAIPMTMTLAANAQQNDHIPPRIENGNLLVLDDALYRTDALARFGGIGERIEIDVVETRFSDTPQQGVNPIFHSSEKFSFRIKSLDPFGLTYDQGRNAKVAQTSLVVVPDGASGKWVMAQIKLRRLIEPKSVNGSVINEEKNSNNRRLVALRKIGDEVVPEDFCIQFSFGKDSSQEVSITISLRKNDEKTNVFTVTPSFELQKGTYRFLCSWHKGRWDKNDPSWRMRVALQTQRSGLMHWDTSEIKSCFVLEENWKHNTISSGSDKYYLSLDNISKDMEKLEVQRIALSEYTEPLWLTFIGSFDQQPIGRPDEYILRKENSGNNLLLSYKGKTDPLNWVLCGLPPKRKFNEGSDPEETKESYEDRKKWWDYSKRDKTTFQLLFVYRPTADINRGSVDTSTGEFIGLFAPDIGTGNAWTGSFTPWHPVSIELQAGDYAYLRSFQRINVNWPELKTDDLENKKLKSKLPVLETWENLIEAIFRNDSSDESTIRPLPEILGPIRFDIEK